MRTERTPAGGLNRGRDRAGSNASRSAAPVPRPLPRDGHDPTPAPWQRRGGTDGSPQSTGAGRRGVERGARTRLPATGWTMPAPRRDAEAVLLDYEDLRLLALLAEGMPVSSVARRVAMSDRTIRRRIRAICEQLGVKATVQAIVWAARRGLV